jgi:hypothetical protein
MTSFIGFFNLAAILANSPGNAIRVVMVGSHGRLGGDCRLDAGLGDPGFRPGKLCGAAETHGGTGEEKIFLQLIIFLTVGREAS